MKAITVLQKYNKYALPDDPYVTTVNNCVSAMEEFAIQFYKYMQDNYRQIDDYHVSKMSLGEKNPIITIESALKEFAEE